ncbi:MAG: ACP S-malonyltransferase [Pseudomonadota bacterium]
MARAYVFPGQGSQFVGMGADLAAAFPAAREVFEEVDDALERKLSKIMAEGPIEELTQTANAQPALMAHSIAVLRVLEKEAGLDIENAMFVAGHSLGEYSALCAAGASTLAETARLLKVRGEAMQAAAEATEGAMAALIGVDVEGAEAAIAALSGGGVCQIANDNAPGQIVISGEKAAVEAVAAGAKAHGAKMAKLLPVSGAFHSPLMAPAAGAMAIALDNAEIVGPKTRLVANVTAAVVATPADIKARLAEQVTGRVRWTESVRFMADEGCDQFVELGAGKVLSGLVRRIAKDASVANIGAPDDLDAFAAL